MIRFSKNKNLLFFVLLFVFWLANFSTVQAATVTITTNGTAGPLTIPFGDTLIIKNGVTLHITGNVVNQGVLEIIDGTLKVDGDFNTTISGQTYDYDSLMIAGNFTNTSAFSIYMGRVILNGAAQTIFALPNSNTYFFNLTVTGGIKSLTGLLIVGGEVDLQTIIKTTSTDTLGVDSAGYFSSLAGFTNHYIQGPMYRRGRHGSTIDPVGMVFPVADPAGVYRPVILYNMQEYVPDKDKPIIKIQAQSTVPAGTSYSGGSLINGMSWDIELVGGKLAGGANVALGYLPSDLGANPPSKLAVLQTTATSLTSYVSLGKALANTSGILSYAKAQLTLGVPLSMAVGAGCTPISATLNVTPNDTICSTSGNVTFSVVTAGGATYDSVFYYINSTLKQRSASGATFTPASIANHDTVRAFILKGLCLDTTNKIVMTVINTAPNAGPDQTVCAGNPVILAGTSIGGGTWSTTGSGTFSPNKTTLNATYTPSAVDIAINNITFSLKSTLCGTTSNPPMKVVFIQAPTLTVPPASITSTGFQVTWPVVSGATSYQVSLNGGAFIAANGGLSHTFSGLTPATLYNVTVKANTATCSVSASITATTLAAAALPCDTSWTAPGSPFCIASLKSPLVPTVTGGIFTGPGVTLVGTTYYFDPAVTGPGTFNVTYTRPCGKFLTKALVVNDAPCATTIAGGPTGTGATFLSKPQGLYTDCNGDIYFTDADSNKVYKSDPTTGIVTILADKNDGLLNPLGLIVDPTTGDVYLANSGKHQILKITAPHVMTVYAGSPAGLSGSANGIGIAASFNNPASLAFDNTSNSIYVSDLNNCTIRKIDKATANVTTILGTPGSCFTSPDGPAATTSIYDVHYLVADANALYFSCLTDNLIKKYVFASGTVSTIVGNSTAGYIDGVPGTHKIHDPLGISLDCSGNIYFADNRNCAIRMASPTGTVTTVAGSLPPIIQCGYADGAGGAARFNHPTALSVYNKGYIDVADTDNKAIRRFAINNWKAGAFNGLDTTHCIYDPADKLNPLTCNVGGTSTFSGKGITLSGSTYSFTPALAGVGRHRIVYKFNAGFCQDSLIEYVNVYPTPKPNLGSDKSLCSNRFGIDSLDAGLNGTKPYASYQWSKSAVNVASPLTAVAGATKEFYKIPLPAPSGGSYFNIGVMVVDSNGCIGGDTIKITSLATYSVNLGQDQSLCEGTTATLTPTVGVGGTISSVLWQDSTTSASYTVSRGAVYSAKVTFSNGCFSTDTVNVTYKFPSALTISSTTPEICNRTITAFAGTGVLGNTNGARLSSSFNMPQNMVKDKAGNIYVTDYGNNKIRKITPAGVVSDYAGTGVAGSTGTTLATATFNAPFGIAIDKNDNLYITEQGSSNVIRKITPGGQVSIFAGVPMAGGWNGDGRKDTTRFWTPAGIVVDGGGNVYVADYGNNVVREISPMGYVQTLGLHTNSPSDVNGSFSVAKYLQPQSLAIDYSGYLFVGNTNGTVRKIDPFLKTISNYTPSLGSLVNVNGIALDNNRNLYASEKNNFTINYVNPASPLSNSVYAGTAGSPGPTNGVTPGTGLLDNPDGLYLDGPVGAPLYVLDKHTIRRVADSCSVGLCPNGSTTLSIPSSGFSNVAWHKVGYPSFTGTTINSSTPGGTAGTYYVTALGSNGCTSVDSIKVISLPLPTALGLAGTDTSVCGTLKNRKLGVPPTAGITAYSWSASPSVGAIASVAQPVIPSIASTTTFTLTVTGTNGCTNTDDALVTIIPAPNVAINDTTVCQSNLDSLTIGPPFDAINNPTYSWTSTDASFIPANTNQVKVPRVSQATYYLQATGTNGCVAKDTMTIKVLPKPSYPYSKNADKCYGDSALVGVNLSNSLYNSYSYQWSTITGVATGLNSDTIFNPIYFNINQTKAFIVTVTDRKTGCQSEPLYDLTFSLVSMYPSPRAGFTYTDVCYPNPIIFTDTSTTIGDDPNFPTTYNTNVWSFGDPASGNADSTSNIIMPSHTFSAAGIYNVKLIVTNSKGGCRDSIIHTVVVNGLNTDFTIPASVCSGSPVTCTNLSTSNPAGPLTCIWDFGDGSATVSTSNSASPPPHIYPATSVAASYNVKLKVISAGCSDSLTKSITILPVPNPAITQSGSSACFGSTIDLNVASTYTTSAGFKVIWRNVTTNTIVTPVSAQTMVTVGSTGIYQATVMDTVGGCSDSSSVNLFFLNPPAGLAIVAPSSSCSNAPLKLISTVTSGDSLQFTWTTSGSGSFSNASNDTTLYTPSPTDVSPLTFQITAVNRCNTANTSQSINLLASAAGTFTYIPTEPFMNDLITFVPDTGTGNNIVKWLWNFQEGNALDSVNLIATHTYMHSGSFPVTLTLINNVGCPTVIVNYVDIAGPVIYIPNVFEPSTTNPENSVVKVYGQSVSSEEFSFRIYDKWGTMVYQTSDFTQANQTGWNGKNMSGGDPLPMGVYTYAVKGHFYDGSTFQKTGTVTLIR